MNCAIYARVSSSEQIKGYSLEAQIEAASAFATERGWSVVAEYVEPGLTATNDRRPQFQRMIRDALSGHFEAVIVYSYDRFSRNMEDAVVYKGLLRRDGIQVVSVTEPVDPASPLSFIYEGIIDLFAAYYSLNLSAKIRGGLGKAIEKGRWPWKTPVGYEKVDGWVRVTEAGVGIRQAFAEFSTGKYTLSEWTERAYRAGLRSQNGGKINMAGWSRIFHNRFYIGRVAWNDLDVEGVHQPLVDRETFDKVQTILAASNGGQPQRVYRNYLLRGLVWSIDSQSAMVGVTAKGKFQYYRSRETGKNGKRHHVPAKKLESQVSIVLSSVAAAPADLDRLDVDDSMKLALQVSQDVGAIYQFLKSDEQRRALLDLVVSKYGLKCSENQIVGVEPNPPFRVEFQDYEFDKKIVGFVIVEPHYFFVPANTTLILAQGGVS